MIALGACDATGGFSKAASASVNVNAREIVAVGFQYLPACACVWKARERIGLGERARKEIKNRPKPNN